MGRFGAILAVALISVFALKGAVVEADFVRSGDLLVSFDADLAPSKLPRSGVAPVKVGFKGSFENLDASDTPALRTMEVRLSRGGRIESTGLPKCSLESLRDRTTAEALSKCRRALVGTGTVGSALRFPDGRRVRSRSKLLLFNTRGGIVMHVFTTEPLRGTFLIPMKISAGSGGFGTVLTAEFPRIAAGYGYLTGFSMVIDRSYSFGGARRSYVVAGCPAPPGLNRVTFELAQVTYRFDGGITIKSGVLRSCSVRG